MKIPLVILWALLIDTCASVPYFLPWANHQQLSASPGPYSSDIIDKTMADLLSTDGKRALKHSEDVDIACPPTCTCHFPKDESTTLVVQGCSKDPVEDIDLLLLRYNKITSLTITNAKLSHLSNKLCNVTKLVHLDLSNNELKTLPWGCFKLLRNITHIDASLNHIKKLKNDSFYLPNLQVLILSHNEILEIDIDVFTEVENMPLIAHIDLSFNKLKNIDPWPVKFSGQKKDSPHINLAHNNIYTFTNPEDWKLDCQHKRPSALIDLRNNSITHVIPLFNGWNITTYIDYLCTFTSSTVDMRGNAFVCDCIDYTFFKLLHLMPHVRYFEELLCSKPRSLQYQEMALIPLDKFVCHVKEKCPFGCECTDIPNEMNMSVSCISSHITELPEMLPDLRKHHYKYYLSFGHTNLRKLEYRHYLQYTRQAQFSHNQIKSISYEAMRALQDSNKIYLDHNALQYLPENIRNISLTSATDIHLSVNDWTCDCHAKETRAWMIHSKKSISDLSGVLCKRPPHLAGRNLVSLSESDLICGSPANNVLIASLIAVGATVCLCLVCFGLIVWSVSTKRVWVFKKFYWHPLGWDECEGEDKEFDVFVCYSSADGLYVEQQLIPELEGRGFKVAFHRAHFIPGWTIWESIEEFIKKSKRTLVVFSNTFHQSKWCRWEIMAALESDLRENNHRLLAIKYEDVDVDTLNLTLQTFFQRYPCIEQNSPNFWEKLERALPVRKMGTVGANPLNVQGERNNDSLEHAHQNGLQEEDSVRSNEDTARLL